MACRVQGLFVSAGLGEGCLAGLVEKKLKFQLNQYDAVFKGVVGP
jgi:hypothetical protein